MSMLTGPGNDYKHQAIITYIVYALMDKFIKTKTYSKYIALPEFSLKPDSAKIPDIAVWKKEKGNKLTPILLIEICWNKKIDDEVKKLTELMERQPTIKESFIVDKENLQIKRIYWTKSKKVSVPQKSSKSDTFKIDLSKFLSALS